MRHCPFEQAGWGLSAAASPPPPPLTCLCVSRQPLSFYVEDGVGWGEGCSVVVPS